MAIRRDGCIPIGFLILALLLATAAPGCRHASRAARTPSPLTPAGDGWTLVVDRLHPHYRGPYLGNGTLGQHCGWLGWAAEEGERPAGLRPPVWAPALIAGLYVREALAPVPSLAAMRLQVDNAVYGQDPQAIVAYRQELRLREGRLVTNATWQSPAGPVSIAVDAAALMHRPHLFVTHLIIQNESQAPAELSAELPPFAGPWSEVPTDVVPPHLPVGALLAWRQGEAADDSAAAAVATLLLPQGDPGAVVASEVAPGRRRPVDRLTVQVPPGRTGDLVRLTAVYTSHDTPQPLVAALREVRAAAQAGLIKLWANHEAAWARAWEADIEIEGDLEAQQLVRTAWFYLRGSVRPGEADGVPPLGLSGEAFSGHVFWDMDTWMLPAVLLQAPDLARAMLAYRYRTLPGARANARAEKRRGASFAWESGRSGREAVGGMVTRHGRHVNGDVALAAWQTWLATGDRDWLLRRGWPLLRETANYWVTRVSRRPEGGLTVRRVVTPDENAGLVNDSAWTNYVAALNLRRAHQAAALLGQSAPDEWRRLAAEIRLPRDPETGLYQPYAGYHGEKAKQADLLLIFHPGGMDLKPDAVARHYDYYADRVIGNGPAMTEAIHSVIAARLGREAEALRRFQESYRPFVRPPFYAFSEKRTRDNVCFLTGMAGCLQAVLYGFAGIELGDTPQPVARPHLPPGWTALRVRGVRWRGATYDLEVRPGAEPAWRRR
ncbi:MAG: glycoside hydrolase family 65 protein [Armatimonadetes bacterium]|nr:glycoside hydrolase family 65 protein [Armatimonadota bacterium]